MGGVFTPHTTLPDGTIPAEQMRSVRHQLTAFIKIPFCLVPHAAGTTAVSQDKLLIRTWSSIICSEKKKPNNTRSVLNLRLETEISRVFPFAADDDGDWAMMNAAIGLFFFLHYTNQITTGAVCLVRLTDRWGLMKTLEFAVSLVCESRWFWQAVSFYRGCLLGLYLDE